MCVHVCVCVCVQSGQGERSVCELGASLEERIIAAAQVPTHTHTHLHTHIVVMTCAHLSKGGSVDCVMSNPTGFASYPLYPGALVSKHHLLYLRVLRGDCELPSYPHCH